MDNNYFLQQYGTILVPRRHLGCIGLTYHFISENHLVHNHRKLLSVIDLSKIQKGHLKGHYNFQKSERKIWIDFDNNEWEINWIIYTTQQFKYFK